MKKFKDQKGITLIALIITIILLLILAIVTISAVNEGNLFAHANNAATKYQEEAELENTKITEWINKMEQIEAGTQNPQTPQTPTDPNDIRGTYYAANGNENHTIVIGDDSIINLAGISGTYDYSDGMISASFYDGAFIINYNYSTLGDGTKVLYTESPRGTASLLATDISKFTTGTLTGTYKASIGSSNGINFKNATEVELLKDESVEKTKTYKYFTQYNLVSIGEEMWFKLEGNNLIEFNEVGTTTTYTKQS